MSTPTKTPRFLDLYHAGHVTAEQIDDYIDAWHDGQHNVSLHVHLGLTWGEYRIWVQDHWLPTAEEHAAERSDAAWMGGDGDDGYLMRVHPPMNCRPSCPIHWPSDHPLAGAPMWWGTEGYVSRSCPHDVFHPDPDDQQVRLHPELAEHECDGCCTASVVDGEFYEDDESVAEVVRALDAATERSITRRPR